MLAGPLRSVSGWAFVKWNMLSRLTRRYVVLRACMLEIHETAESRTPLFSACVVGSTMYAVPQKKECHVRVDGHRVLIQWNSEAEMRACRAAFEFANRKIEDFYKIVAHRQLGKGRASEVVFAFDVASGEHTAVKVIDKETSRPTDRIFAEKEVAIRMSVQHSTIVQTLDIFESPFDLFLVMEYMGGGSLSRRLSKRGSPLTEGEARVIMARLFSALAYLHSRGIVHRNVKPENILLDFADEYRWPETAKLSDFGLACTVDDPDACLKVVGTPEFLAPEASTMVNGPGGRRQVAFGNEVDMWAAGVTMYNVLSLELPFDGDSTPDILRSSRSGKFEFSSTTFDKVSPEAKSLVRSLINPDRRKRLTAVTVLQHSWFDKALDSNGRVVTRGFRRPRPGYPMFRSAALIMAAICRLYRTTSNTSKIRFTGKRIQSNVGGINICPSKPRLSTASDGTLGFLSASRISNSSTVHSRSSLGEDTIRRVDVESLASVRNIEDSLKADDDHLSDSPPYWRNTRMDAVAKGISAMMRSDGAADGDERMSATESSFVGHSAFRLRSGARSSARKGSNWEDGDSKPERRWRLREAKESRSSQHSRGAR